MFEIIIGKAIAKIRWFGCVAITAAMLVVPVAAHAGVAILQYHHIGDDTPRVTSVTTKELEQHLEFLVQQQFTVIDLTEVAALLASDEPLPAKTAAITIDDGWRNVYDNGLELFKRYRMPFTIFV